MRTGKNHGQPEYFASIVLPLAKFHLSISPIWKSPFPWLCEQIVSPGRELFLQDKALEAEPAEQGTSMLMF